MDWKKAEEYAGNMGSLSRGGFDPFGPWIQAIEETGYFQRVIGNFNFWGLKAPRWWHGKTVLVPTHEWVVSTPELCEINKCANPEPHNHYISATALFMDFDDIGHAFRIYAKRICRIYKNAWGNRSFPILFFEGLQNGKYQWSTNQNYSHAMTQLYNQLIVDKEHLEVLLPRIKEFEETRGIFS